MGLVKGDEDQASEGVSVSDPSELAEMDDEEESRRARPGVGASRYSLADRSAKVVRCGDGLALLELRRDMAMGAGDSIGERASNSEGLCL